MVSRDGTDEQDDLLRYEFEVGGQYEAGGSRLLSMSNVRKETTRYILKREREILTEGYSEAMEG